MKTEESGREVSEQTATAEAVKDDGVESKSKIEGTQKYGPDVTYAWKDITQEFFEAVKDLSLGELVHHKMFGLFEAMSAIEMMDPKMDAGMCCNKNTPTPLTFDTAVSVSIQIRVKRQLAI